jgi:glutaredoxin
MKYVGGLLVLIAFFLIGLEGGPYARAAYDTAFPPKEYVEGDWSAATGRASTPVVIFTTSTCPYCRQLREYLDRRRIPYTDHVADQSASAARLHARLGSDVVPVIVVGRRKYTGFSQAIGDRIAIDVQTAASTP